MRHGEDVTVLRVSAESVAPGPAIVAVRPEKIELSVDSADRGNVVAGEVAGHVFRGSYHAYEVSIAGREDPVFVYNQARSRSGDQVFQPGQRVYLSWDEADSVLLAQEP